MRFPFPRLYAIIDAAQLGDRAPEEATERLLRAGVRLLQYRAKLATSRQLFEAALRMAAQVARAGGVLVVNDRADVALAARARGVHLGQQDLPVEMARRILGDDFIIGCSTHSLDQAEEADRSPADYVALGPIFATESKAQPDSVVGLDGLREARRATRKPLVAIGGITLENALEVIAAGADSVAVIHDLLAAPDLEIRARQFLQLLM